ncbi:MAG: hypothetical protein EOP10_07200 [Proteobacteria bacterium]|nr:MAG: hypothetical protein EOP10_07200 [Pseudomonadota bacterium]
MFVARSHLEPFYKDSKKLEADLKVAAESSTEDGKLFEWLCLDDDVWPALCPVFERRLGTRKGFEAWLLKADSLGFQLSPDMKRIGAYFVLLELREFGGHTLWNRAGKIPHYEDIVRNVHDRVSTRFGIATRKEMSVADRELSLSAIILRESLDQLSADKVKSLLKDANFDSVSDWTELRQGLLEKIGTVGVSSIKSIVGKQAAKKFGASLIETAFGANRLAKAGSIGGFASKVLPLALRRAGLYISLGFLLKDAYQLGGEATRVTNPAVIIISLYRSFSGR